jgi:hypothetical protein
MNAQPLTPNRVSFSISEVRPASERLPEITVRAALERTGKARLLTCPKAEDRVVEGGDFHPLIAAAAIAYKQHFPLVLSPDMLWLTILQGVAQHIANDHESLRTKLVAHKTKLELVVPTSLASLPSTDEEMMAVTTPFVELINKHIQPDKRFLLKTEFSTTTDVERIAGAIVVMDTFQPYFDYVFRLICGIPAVTLEGTTQDWEFLAERTKLLHESDLNLSWWTQHLLPLCEQFIRASRGDVDQNHWQNLCKLVQRYGADDLNGWLLKFIPYVRNEQNEAPIHRNPVLELTSDGGEVGRSLTTQSTITGCTSNMLPTGVSRVPVICQNSSSGENIRLQFFAGLVGVSQSEIDRSLRPLVGWALAEPSRIETLVDELRTKHGCIAPARVETEKMIEALDYLTGDMWKFYSEIENAYLTYPRPNEYGETDCSIKSYYYIKPLWDGDGVVRELESLCEQGEISTTFLAERKKFVIAYGKLRVIAEASMGKRTAYYVTGHIPKMEARIFRWSGKRTLAAFTPVAESFADWVATVLASASQPAD